MKNEASRITSYKKVIVGCTWKVVRKDANYNHTQETEVNGSKYVDEWKECKWNDCLHKFNRDKNMKQSGKCFVKICYGPY